MVGMDEVGRGALAGPVAVGAVAIDGNHRRPPTGVRDSKLLTPAARERLIRPIGRWALHSAVGMASSRDIDRLGITAALGLAGRRALAMLGLDGVDVVILDGSHDWLTRTDSERQAELFDQGGMVTCDVVDGTDGGCEVKQVMTRVKGDMAHTTVAAASVLAKVARDALMVQSAMAFPEYGWQTNKGYAAAEHRAALLRHGPTPMHRVSWRLGLAEPRGAVASG